MPQMTMKKVFIVLLLLLAPVALAQLPWEITDLRCGNGKLDQFEMCEKGLGDGLCNDYYAALKIDGACDVAHCTCLPRVNMVYCGNNIREGIEACDGSGQDMCPTLANITNLSLSCNAKKCICSINQSLPSDYNPEVIEALENASGKASVCGDKKVERAEDCDPPDTLCTTNTKDPGICTSKCKCLTPEQLAEEANPKLKVNETNTTVNSSEPNMSTEPKEVNVSVEAPEQPKSEPGFFSKIWSWIVGLFS